ncbi:MAG: hypothetical protein WC188_04665 [Candidatus Caldatribacteriota bacterium]|jgi:hypothetical protein|nr:hypothetical protein [Patescibacteria group bacterium]
MAKTNQKIDKKFLALDLISKWTWWKEEVTYSFIPPYQIVELKISETTAKTFNIYAATRSVTGEISFKLMENKKTITSAKKYVEEIVRLMVFHRHNEFFQSVDKEAFLNKRDVVGYYISKSSFIKDKNNLGWNLIAIASTRENSIIIGTYETEEIAKKVMEDLVMTGRLQLPPKKSDKIDNQDNLSALNVLLEEI